MTDAGGPLAGLKIVEVEGLGAVPFAAMMLADMGADVIRVARPGGGPPGSLDRGRPAVELDLTHPEGVETVLRLVESADALIEGGRPGTMEGLGLGPEACLARNPCLVYGRMTGWGQDGPLAHSAGHDINFIAIAGALRNFARPGEPPVPPMNLLGDFGGGGLLLAFGVVSGVWEAARSGRGQVVDAAMTDGTALLMTMVCGMLGRGEWPGEPGTNLFDGGAPYYGVYETADREYVSVGAVEPHLYREMLDRMGVPPGALPNRDDREKWPELRRRLADMFRSRARDEWVRIFEGSEACVTPVLRIEEAYRHPHNTAREVFVEHDGLIQPAPAPRFARTPGRIRSTPDAEATLVAWGIVAEDIEWLRAVGAMSDPDFSEAGVPDSPGP